MKFTMKELAILGIDLLLLSLIYVFCDPIIGIYNACIIASLVSIFIITWAVKSRKEIGIVAVIFVIVYYCCVFGRITLIYVFNYETDTYFDSLYIFSEEALTKAVVFSTLCFIGIHIGMVIKRKKFEDTYTIACNYEKSENTIIALQNTKNIIFLITIIPVIVEYIMMFLSRTGYFIMESNNLLTAISILSNLFSIWLIIEIAVDKNKTAYYIGLFYYITTLFWGGRGKPILMIITLMMVYDKFIKKKEYTFFSKITLYAGAIGIATLFTAIFMIRDEGIFYIFKNLWATFTYILGNKNPILELIYEIGVAIGPITATMEHVPEYLDYQYGLTILSSILGMIPDPIGFFPYDIRWRMNIPIYFYGLYNTTWGGSILQDFYINFSYFSVFFLIFVGIFVVKISSYLSKYKINSNMSLPRYLFYASLIFPILWWPRSSLGFFARYFGTVCVIPLVIFLLFYSRNKKIMNNKKEIT